MSKTAILLTVFILSIPCAATTVTFTDTGGGVITWSSDGAGIVAMALDVDMTPGQVDSVAVDSFFDIFMDAAYDEEAGDGYSYGEGTPIADQDAAGQLVLPQTNFCISMGGLGGESEPLDPAPTSGTITFTGTGAGTLNENALRGGVIDENGDRVITNLPTPGPLFLCCDDCMVDAGIDVSDPALYAEFIAAGSPKCWCYPTQCQGDTDGYTEGGAALGFYHVGSVDIGVLAGAWRVTEPTKGPGITTVTISTVNGPVKGACADFDHALEGGAALGFYRVGSLDIGILAGNWRITEPTKGPGIAKTCLPGNRTAP